jgi:hypothetical protein
LFRLVWPQTAHASYAFVSGFVTAALPTRTAVRMLIQLRLGK